MTSTNLKLVFIAILPALLNGCAEIPQNYAPVTTNNPGIAKDDTKYHQVKKGDTLYAISLVYDMDYQQLAQWNQIVPPYTIEIAQKIRLSDPNLESTSTYNHTNAGSTTPIERLMERPPKAEAVTDSRDGKDTTPRTGEVEQRMEQLPRATHGAVAETNKKIVTATVINKMNAQNTDAIPLNHKPNPTDKIQSIKNIAIKSGIRSQKKSVISIDNRNMLKLNFQWPIKGKVLKYFSPAYNKGIDIAGKTGQDVSAAEAGKVVYSGQGLIGYGNLLIIKHNDLYLSAYANNSQLLVTEGHTVGKGEVIAKAGQASLHFEIRKNGKPVNPLNFLPGK
ncbi:peptidoglycan DD-metalloendopeptidase family protein [Methylobacter svalbardensis]|uniref:peptidoglycan DD-metalloendopeptidase family protein n=1 Tax=Methylobacter svalbardensis TaxID=3080016 RepID=UPI0030EB7F04